jgi:hypothetical protein
MVLNHEDELFRWKMEVQLGYFPFQFVRLIH